MYVACRFYCLARHSEHIEPEGPIDAGDADGGQECADCGRNKRDQEGYQIGDVDPGLQIDRNRRHGGHHDDEDQGQYGEQDCQGHLVRSFLPLGAFHEMDHAVEEAFTRIGGGADEERIGNQRGACGYRREYVRARLLEHGRRLAGDGQLVHISHTLDHLAVGRDDLALVHADDIILAQDCRRHLLDFARGPNSSGHQLLLGPPQ